MPRTNAPTATSKAALTIEISKRADGGGVLRCVRADGSVTWQKQGRQAPFFALHDLTHLAVETTLGYRQGFFGLIAAGWDVEDTGGKGSRGKLPVEAIEVENIVGAFDAERGCGTLFTPAEFRDFSAARGLSRTLTEEEILRVRAKRGELFARWAEAPEGAALRLCFP